MIIYINMIEQKDREIRIVSGEGILGFIKKYTGKRTIRAIKSRLTRERCGGDRWARAEIFSHHADDGRAVFINLETGEHHLHFYKLP